jgi:hypothetical protein
MTARDPQFPIERHLVLVRRQGWQSNEDWQRIAHHVEDIEPRIAVFIVQGTARNAYSRRKAAERPTLVFSPGPLLNFRPLRGKVYAGGPVPKIEQVRRFREAGLPVPRTAVLSPDLVLDPAEWGEFVIVKPTDLATSSHGAGIQLMRTARVRYRAPADYPPGHPGRRGPMVVQQYVNTGDRISLHRVLTLFGEPLYANYFEDLNPRVSLTASDEEIESATIATQTLQDRHSQFIASDDVLALARAAHEAIPEAPLKGCDIIREASTGQLFLLEVNPGGNTWHFSSDHLAARRAEGGAARERRRIQQFDAFRTAARVLVRRTMAEAE